MMYVREFRSSLGGKLGAVVAGAVLLVVVGVFLAFGFVLLLALAAAGLLLGVGTALLRRLTGRGPAPLDAAGPRHGLDPSLEVKPPHIERESREP
ncbi:MAG: hypothetical protein ACSLFE_03885 [Gemmatimonadaceae bacterium]